MQAISTYHIKVEGQVDENSLNASGPLHISAIRAGQADTLLAIYADQAGLIGVLRYLHQHGFVIEAVQRNITRPNKNQTQIVNQK